MRLHFAPRVYQAIGTRNTAAGCGDAENVLPSGPWLGGGKYVSNIYKPNYV
jgi:hypothetical protein